MGTVSVKLRRMGPTTFRRLTLDWETICASAASRRALNALSARSPAISELGLADLGRLVGHLDRREGSLGRVARGAVVRDLLAYADSDPLVPRALLQALVPGMAAVGRRLRWGGGGPWKDEESFCADLVTATWSVVEDWTGQVRTYAGGDILDAVRQRLVRQRASYRRLAARGVALVDGEDVNAGGSVLDQLAGALVEAVLAGAPRSDVALVYATRVLGYSLQELAAWSGCDAGRLRYRRRCIEVALCA